jgi:predicted dehydrogenase
MTAKRKREKSLEPIRCGIVGLGRIGWGHHAQIVLKHPGFELAAVCDIEPARLREAQAASPGCAAYTNYAALVKDPRVELIVVASQSKDHVARSRLALRAGKHVLAEKPLARTPVEVDRLARLAAGRGRVFTIHHNYRVSPEFLFVKEIVASGKLGRVFRIRRHQLAFARRNDWQTLRKYGGGAIGNWGVHLVDMCLCLVNSPVRDVWGTAAHYINPGDAEDDVKALIRLKDGTMIDIELTSACACPAPRWVIMGTCGTFWVDGDGVARLKYFQPRRLRKLAVNDTHLAAGRAYGLQGKDAEIPWIERTLPIEPRGRYPSFYDNLYEAVRHGAPLIVDPASARVTYDVLARIRKGTGF